MLIRACNFLNYNISKNKDPTFVTKLLLIFFKLAIRIELINRTESFFGFDNPKVFVSFNQNIS